MLANFQTSVCIGVMHWQRFDEQINYMTNAGFVNVMITKCYSNLKSEPIKPEK
jgi:hypothetical protein